MIKYSCIYSGNVIHKRFKPKIHFFKYKVFSLLIDLDELNTLHKQLSIFSYNKFNLISFYDADHGPRDGTSIKHWVIQNLKKNKIPTSHIKIKLLCYPRILGYVFNPLSVFFIYNQQSKLIAIFYEVKNTFGEQHTYIFKINKQQQRLQHDCSKKFYVSPFLEMNCTYYFKIVKPGKKISIVIDQHDELGKILYASQDGTKEILTNTNLIKTYLKHPLMSFKVIVAIHFEAMKLWLKRIKLISKNIKMKNNITIENL